MRHDLPIDALHVDFTHVTLFGVDFNDSSEFPLEWPELRIDDEDQIANLEVSSRFGPFISAIQKSNVLLAPQLPKSVDSGLNLFPSRPEIVRLGRSGDGNDDGRRVTKDCRIEDVRQSERLVVFGVGTEGREWS